MYNSNQILKLRNSNSTIDGVYNSNGENTIDMHIKYTTNRQTTNNDATNYNTLLGPRTGNGRHVQVNASGFVGVRTVDNNWYSNGTKLNINVWHRLTVVIRTKKTQSSADPNPEEVSHGTLEPPYTQFYIDGVYNSIVPYAVDLPVFTVGGAHDNSEKWSEMSDIHFYHVGLQRSEIAALKNIRNPLLKRRVVLFENEERTQTLTVNMPTNDVCEPHHPTVVLHLLDLEPTGLFMASNGVSVGQTTHTIFVADDDDSGRIGFDSSSMTETERKKPEGTDFQVTLKRWGGSSGDVVTRWWIEGREDEMGRTASRLGGIPSFSLDPNDFEGQTSGTFTMENGINEKTLTININNDAMFEYNEETKSDDTLRIHLGPLLLAFWDIETELDISNNEDRSIVVATGNSIFTETTSFKRTVVDASPNRHHLSIVGLSPIWTKTLPKERWGRSSDGTHLRLGHSYLTFDTEAQQDIFSGNQAQASGYSRMELVEELSNGQHYNGAKLNLHSNRDYLISLLFYPVRSSTDATKEMHILSKGCNPLFSRWFLKLDKDGIPSFTVVYNDLIERTVKPDSTAGTSLFDQWNHLSVHSSNGKLVLTVDGVAIATTTFTDLSSTAHMNDNTGPVVLGGGDILIDNLGSDGVTSRVCTSRAFTGHIDMVRIESHVDATDLLYTEQYPRPMCYYDDATGKLKGGQIGNIDGVAECLRTGTRPSSQIILDQLLLKCTNTSNAGVLFGNVIDLTIQDNADKSPPGKPAAPILVSKTGGAITLQLSLPDNNGGGEFQKFEIDTDSVTSPPGSGSIDSTATNKITIADINVSYPAGLVPIYSSFRHTYDKDTRQITIRNLNRNTRLLEI
jgi:hypothetical protein